MAQPIVPWIGGKRRLSQTLLARFPPHTCYVEVFAGGAALFFLRETPASLLVEYPRYLKALKLRGERALADPVKDQARLLELRPYADALARADETGQARREAWQEFRQDLEELRVQTFAQELGTRRAVSHKRMAKQLESLSRGA